MSKKMSTVGEGLAALNNLDLHGKMPDLPRFDEAELAKQVDAIRAHAEKVGNWVGNFLAQKIALAEQGREAMEAQAEAMERGEEYLSHVLYKDKTPAFRRAAWLALLHFHLKQELTTRSQAWNLLRQLVSAGYLQEAKDGDIVLHCNGGGRYTFPEAACFGEPELTALQTAMDGLWEDTTARERQLLTEQTQVLFGEADPGLTFHDFLGGKPGRYCFRVPAEEIVDKKSGPTGKWRCGGTILVEVKEGKRAWPLKAIGGIERGVQEVKSRKLFLFSNSLTRSLPPVPEGLDQDSMKKLHLFWYLLKRGIRNLQEKEEAEQARAQIAETRERFGKMATVSPQEFFLERKPGICLAEYEGAWTHPKNADQDEEIQDLFLLVERRAETDGIPTIRIVEVPKHLGGFFAKCEGQDWPEEDEKFSGVGQPLRAVLKAVWGQVYKTCNIRQTAAKTEATA